MTLGAVVGDVIGSYFENRATKSKDIRLFNDDAHFTDDTAMTVAVANILLTGADIAETFHRYFEMDPYAGYGAFFGNWCMKKETEPLESFGNGSAMRTSPVAYYSDDLRVVLNKAEEIAAVTHNTEEGIKGALSVTHSIFLARNNASKEEIKKLIEQEYDYDLTTPLSVIRPTYQFNATCQGSVPQAIRCFLEAENYEDTIRNAISLGGDADTQACIAGSIAEAYFKQIPEELTEFTMKRLPAEFIEVIDTFYETYIS